MCWHDVQIKKNGNYIFAVSQNRISFLRKNRDFSNQELTAYGFLFLLIYLLHAL